MGLKSDEQYTVDGSQPNVHKKQFCLIYAQKRLFFFPFLKKKKKIHYHHVSLARQTLVLLVVLTTPAPNLLLYNILAYLIPWLCAVSSIYECNPLLKKAGKIN